MSGIDSLYPITERLRCLYNGREFATTMKVSLPTPLMLEAADEVDRLTQEVERLKEIVNTVPKVNSWCLDQIVVQQKEHAALIKRYSIRVKSHRQLARMFVEKRKEAERLKEEAEHWKQKYMWARPASWESDKLNHYKELLGKIEADVNKWKPEHERTLADLQGKLSESLQKAEELKKWREQQLEVESTWDIQEVARLIGCQLGEYIRPKIAPYVRELHAKLARYAKSLEVYGFTDEGGEYLKPPIQNSGVIEYLLEKLKRYESGIEAEGVHWIGEIHLDGRITLEDGQPVTVLVMAHKK